MDIEDIRVSNETDILHKIKELILNSGGSEEEYVNLQQFSFISSWGDESLLDIIAEHMSIKEL